MLKQLCAVDSRIDQILLVGGSIDNPVGEFSETMDVLRSGVLDEFPQIKKIGMA